MHTLTLYELLYLGIQHSQWFSSNINCIPFWISIHKSFPLRQNVFTIRHLQFTFFHV